MNEYKSNLNFSKTFKIRDKITKEEVNNSRTEDILKSEPFIKAVRALAGNISHLSYTSAQDYHNWKLSYSQNSFKVCSDSPIIFKTANPKNIFESDFIFPVTKKHLLMRTFNSLEIKFLKPEICMVIDLIIFKQAKLFCCCSRKDYLTTISSLANNYDLEALKNRLFQYIHNHPCSP